MSSFSMKMIIFNKASIFCIFQVKRDTKVMVTYRKEVQVTQREKKENSSVL